ncbi:unnamed protein product [Nippostrongylus brasiliensis]|uniref:Uncharacterized protein n=1 Tax=Nippostrongylus brasiliensis TaxID=27835 RepID=A0A0N4XEP2_NIPBR|nr:unnamed protein product [Nippostrongylus brasiliensis]
MDCIKRILDFLAVDCMPVTLYRMGKPVDSRPRLLKVVMPNSFFANLLLKRAHRLKAFPVPRVFIRPSLSQAERERRTAKLHSIPVMGSSQTSANTCVVHEANVVVSQTPSHDVVQSNTVHSNVVSAPINQSQGNL